MLFSAGTPATLAGAGKAGDVSDERTLDLMTRIGRVLMMDAAVLVFIIAALCPAKTQSHQVAFARTLSGPAIAESGYVHGEGLMHA